MTEVHIIWKPVHWFASVKSIHYINDDLFQLFFLSILIKPIILIKHTLLMNWISLVRYLSDKEKLRKSAVLEKIIFENYLILLDLFFLKINLFLKVIIITSVIRLTFLIENKICFASSWVPKCKKWEISLFITQFLVAKFILEF